MRQFLLPRREFPANCPDRKKLLSSWPAMVSPIEIHPGGILHSGQIIALRAKRVNDDFTISSLQKELFSWFSRRGLFRFDLVQNLSYLAPPAKEIITGADRRDQNRAQAVHQGENDALLPGDCRLHRS